MASPPRKPSVQQALLVGIVILALAAILITWMDQSGLFMRLHEAFEAPRY